MVMPVDMDDTSIGRAKRPGAAEAVAIATQAAGRSRHDWSSEDKIARARPARPGVPSGGNNAGAAKKKRLQRTQGPSAPRVLPGAKRSLSGSGSQSGDGAFECHDCGKLCADSDELAAHQIASKCAVDAPPGKVARLEYPSDAEGDVSGISPRGGQGGETRTPSPKSDQGDRMALKPGKAASSTQNATGRSRPTNNQLLYVPPPTFPPPEDFAILRPASEIRLCVATPSASGRKPMHIASKSIVS